MLNKKRFFVTPLNGQSTLKAYILRQHLIKN